MLKVKKILGDDIFGLWHVKQIIINNEGKRFSFAPDDERFCSKEEAEIHAHHRALHFIQRKLGLLITDPPTKGQRWSGSLLAKTTSFVNRLQMFKH